jgi:hypothetical protein
VRWARAAHPGTHNTDVHTELLDIGEAELASDHVV